eukprot:2578081-Prymnesium_polylepis.1
MKVVQDAKSGANFLGNEGVRCTAHPWRMPSRGLSSLRSARNSDQIFAPLLTAQHPDAHNLAPPRTVTVAAARSNERRSTAAVTATTPTAAKAVPGESAATPNPSSTKTEQSICNLTLSFFRCVAPAHTQLEERPSVPLPILAPKPTLAL